MINIDDNKLRAEYDKIKSYQSYYETYGAPLVNEYAKELDNKVDSITIYLEQCRTYNLDFDVVSLQRMVMELSSTIYYTASRLEQLEILADMAKLSYKDKYNTAYTSRQGGATVDRRKYTADQLRAIADQEALEEELVHFIYSHCADVLKTKIDAANELLKGVSKSLSAEIASMQMTGYTANKVG